MVLNAIKSNLNLVGEVIISEPLSGSCTAVALGEAITFRLFTGTVFGNVFGAFAGSLFMATIPQVL